MLRTSVIGWRSASVACLIGAKIQYHDETQQKGRQFHFLNELENLRGLRESL
jgi:hypothetical protein